MVSASDTESDDDQDQPDTDNQEEKPLQLLGDEVFETLEIDSLEKDLQALEKEVWTTNQELK